MTSSNDAPTKPDLAIARMNMPDQNTLARLLLASALLLSGCAQSRFQLALEFGTPAEPAALGSQATRDERASSPLPAQAVAAEDEDENSESGEASEQMIDLASALAMGGANHLQIALARERVVQAHSNLITAQALRLPSLQFGVGWNKHDGRLQETQGNVLEVSRNSLFVGGGLGLGNAPPIAGGSSGPARLAVNLSLADAYFAPLIADRQLDSAYAAESATFNDSLLQISRAYIDLLEAYGLQTNAQESQAAAQELVKLSRDFLETGAGSQAEVDRAATELRVWETAVQESNRQVAVRAAELARLLRIERGTQLVPADETLVALEVIDRQLPLATLIDQGLDSRPELVFHQSQVASANQQIHQEYWRPWLPHVVAGTSFGSFGGGPSSQFDNQSGRSDIDLIAVWEWKNLGYGNLALRERAISQMRQAQFQADWTSDRIRTQIVTAFEDVHSFAQQIESTRQQILASRDSYDRNLKRVRQSRGLPIELLQATRAQATALAAHTRAICQYNRAQFRLLHAIGTTPTVETEADTAGNVTPEEVPEEEAEDPAEPAS
ncbi:MAG: TolC family protein [Planctomycetota bacterium]|nr:TolC family protein [Planctomycetota bacterium]